MIIKEYSDKNKKEVISLFKANIPEFFAPSEEQDLIYYLENEVEDYFIVEEGSKIIGAGGINYFSKEKAAYISWDAILPNMQGRGIGKILIQHRINHINKNSQIKDIVVRTSQLVYEFYEKMGFELEKVEKDFWAKGIDLYQMRMKNKTKVK